jgi:hypothetical protein
VATRRSRPITVTVAVAVAVAVAAAVACVLLAGCGGGNTHERASASSSATASPTSPASASSASASVTASRTGPLPSGPGVSPGETPPVLAAAGTLDTQLGAVVFAKFFFQAIDWSIATMDPYLIQKYSEPTCNGCANSIKMITNLTKTKGYVVGGRISPSDAQISFEKFDIPSSYAVKVALNQSAETVVHSPGAAPSVAFATPQVGTQWLLVDWVGDGFQAREIVGS